MALTESQTGTQTATINTEHTLGSEETADAYFQLRVDVSVLANGDVLELRWKVKVESGGTARQEEVATFRDAQENGSVLSPPIPNIHGLTFTLKQTAGTGRDFDWQILKA